MLLFTLTLLCVGGLVALISGVWTLALAFQRHVLWGLAVLFVPFGGNVAFLCVNWREAKIPFFLGLASALLMGTAFSTIPRGTFTLPFHLAVMAVERDQQEQRVLAEQVMESAREKAATELRLIHLKEREEVLRARRDSLCVDDQVSALQISADIRRYNAELGRELVAR